MLQHEHLDQELFTLYRETVIGRPTGIELGQQVPNSDQIVLGKADS